MPAAEFCEKAKVCKTLIFPAFVMLDTVKAKAFSRKKTIHENRPNAQKDYMQAMKHKQMKPQLK